MELVVMDPAGNYELSLNTWIRGWAPRGAGPGELTGVGEEGRTTISQAAWSTCVCLWGGGNL